jgi:hypothetical protein
MNITCGVVQIVKSESIYFVSTNQSGVVLSLGSYDSLREAVEMPLANAQVTPVAKAALESIWKKGEELNWKEQEVFDAFASR